MNVQRVNELFHKEIVNQATGEKQATVSDIVFDGEVSNIVALLVGGGLLSRARVVRWASIVSLGDVIVVGDEASLDKLGNDPEVEELHKRAFRITGTDIVTEAGEKTGTVNDLFVDRRGRIIGYEVKQGLVRSSKFLPIGKVRTVGKDAIIASDSDLEPVKDVEKG